MNQQYPSTLLEKAVGEFSKLPGIGRKTAMRLVLHLLRQDTSVVEAFGSSIITLKHEVKYCKVCHNISDTETCQICANPQRDASMVCVVENIRDVMAVEATQQYRGLYHVLGGVISPMDGVGPGDLQIESLVRRVAEGGIILRHGKVHSVPACDQGQRHENCGNNCQKLHDPVLSQIYLSLVFTADLTCIFPQHLGFFL